MNITAFWFRRDLRLSDNAGLMHALKSGNPVQCFFIYDKNILDLLSSKSDARVQFIQHRISLLKEELQVYGSDLICTIDTPDQAWNTWIQKYSIKRIFCNKDYEPYAKERDQRIHHLAIKNNIIFSQFKDHLIFESEEIRKSDSLPYTVFTAYKKACFKKLISNNSEIQNSYFLKSYPTEKYFNNFNKLIYTKEITLEEIGFCQTEIIIPAIQLSEFSINNYHLTRDYPNKSGTSRLGIHFRFGTISIREYFVMAAKFNEMFLIELLWREFYSSILQAFPNVVVDCFKNKYNKIEWRNNEKEFQLWCNGKTGIPLVDAGIRELNTTGFMHNRVRMITASFLVKNLLIDWRWGEAYFAEKLLDYDLASNNGGWQWVAGCGTDAAPYFRIFNPYIQQKKFDPEFEYIKSWIPEFGSSNYPEPIVELSSSAKRCIQAYKKALYDE
ncbi:MAG: deoxyribodipyrimidine photo-lyase [Saprospiraceae bacterium]